MALTVVQQQTGLDTSDTVISVSLSSVVAGHSVVVIVQTSFSAATNITVTTDKGDTVHHDVVTSGQACIARISAAIGGTTQFTATFNGDVAGRLKIQAFELSGTITDIEVDNSAMDGGIGGVYKGVPLYRVAAGTLLFGALQYQSSLITVDPTADGWSLSQSQSDSGHQRTYTKVADSDPEIFRFTGNQNSSGGVMAIGYTDGTRTRGLKYKSSTTATDNSFTSSTMIATRPLGIRAGDRLLAAVTLVSPSTPPTITSPASGWSQVGSDLTFAVFGGAYQVRMQIWERIVEASEPSTYSFTLSGAGAWGAKTSAFGNGPTTGTAAVGFSTATASGTSINAPSVTTTENEQDMVVVMFNDASALWSTATALVEVEDSGGSAFLVEHRASAGATGTRAMTSASSGAMAAISLAMKDSVVDDGGDVETILRHMMQYYF